MLITKNERFFHHRRVDDEFCGGCAIILGSAKIDSLGIVDRICRVLDYASEFNPSTAKERQFASAD